MFPTSTIQRKRGLKPLGTITMCFPHIDEKTKTTLKSVMEEAKNYADFTERICKRVCSEPTSPLLEYFAFFFPFHITDYNLIDKLVNSGKVPVLAKPLLLITRYRRGESIDWDQMQHSLNEALKEAPNDWISIHLYLKWRCFAEWNFPSECYTEVEQIQSIAKRVNEKKELEFFKTYFLRFEISRLNADMRFREMYKLLDQAYLIARKHDEQVMVADLLTLLASTSEPTMERGLDFLNSALELSEQLGYRYRIGHVHQQFGYKRAIRGEWNASIKHLQEFHRSRESIGLQANEYNSIIAWHYNQIGDGDEALKLVDRAIQSHESIRRQRSFSYAQRAYALINLGRYDEARSELAVAKEISSTSGSAWMRFLWVQLVEAILERAERNFDSAKTTFEDILNTMEENTVHAIQNRCLLNLTEIEIEQLDIESLDTPIDSSGIWMQRLEDHAEKMDYPGIIAQSLILKAKLRQKQGRYDEVITILNEVLKAAKTPSMRYLNDMVNSTFPDINIT